MSSNAIMGHEIFDALGQALDIDITEVRRIVMDAEWGQPLIVNVEMYGDKRFTQYDWGVVKGAQIVRSEPDELERLRAYKQLVLDLIRANYGEGDTTLSLQALQSIIDRAKVYEQNPLPDSAINNPVW